MKKICKLVIIISILFLYNKNIVFADTIINTHEIPLEAKEYAIEAFPNIFLESTKKPYFGTTDVDYRNIFLGNPYYIPRLEQDGTFNEDIIYFPILEDDKIKLLLSVYKINGKWKASISNELVNDLNSLRTDEPYFLYSIDGIIYAETDDEIVIFQNNKKELYFKTTYLDNNKIMEKIDNYSSVNICEKLINTAFSDRVNFSTIENIQNIELYTIPSLNGSGDHVSLEFLGCLVDQKDGMGIQRGMCWAAAVASVVRYVKAGRRTLTASDVCDKMNKGYDDGGTFDDMHTALSKYGIDNYIYLNTQASWSNIVSKLSAGHPIIMGGRGTSAGQIYYHVVTMWSCDKIGTNRYVNYYNSSSDAMYISEYDSSGTSIRGCDIVFTWNRTLY